MDSNSDPFIRPSRISWTSPQMNNHNTIRPEQTSVSMRPLFSPSRIGIWIHVPFGSQRNEQNSLPNWISARASALVRWIWQFYNCRALVRCAEAALARARVSISFDSRFSLRVTKGCALARRTSGAQLTRFIGLDGRPSARRRPTCHAAINDRRVDCAASPRSPPWPLTAGAWRALLLIESGGSRATLLGAN